MSVFDIVILVAMLVGFLGLIGYAAQHPRPEEA